MVAVACATTAFSQKRTTRNNSANQEVTATASADLSALKLTEKQKAEIAVLEQEIAERKSKYLSANPDKAAQIEEKLQGYRTKKIRAILSEEQVVLFDELVKNNGNNYTTSINPVAYNKIARLTDTEINQSIDLTTEQKNTLKLKYNELNNRAHKNNLSDTYIMQERIEILRNLLTDEQFLKLTKL